MNQSRVGCAVLALAIVLVVPSLGSAQRTGLENGEWRYLGGDAGHTGFTPLDQIDASNFADLEVAWIWRGDNFGPSVEYTFRSTPVFADGVLYTVVGQRRQVAAIDAATGETLWLFREPETLRYRRSPRTDFGKGVAMRRWTDAASSTSRRLPSSSGPSTPRRGSPSRTGGSPSGWRVSRAPGSSILYRTSCATGSPG